MVANQQTHFLNQFRLGCSKKAMYFDTVISAKSKPVARLLQRLNLVRRFYRLSGSVYRVFPAYSKYRKATRPLKCYARTNGRIILTYRSLKLLNLNSPHSYYVLDTAKGLMTHKEALRLRVGGLLLAIVR